LVHSQPPWCDVGPDEAWVEFGRRVKLLRERRLPARLRSQRALVEALTQRGVAMESHTTLGRIEKGTGRPGVDFVLELARLARVSPAWLLTGVGPMELDPEPDALQAAFRLIREVVLAVDAGQHHRVVRVLEAIPPREEASSESESEDSGASEA
jgi:transcriptional regulator with XRE-family HTH domain